MPDVRNFSWRLLSFIPGLLTWGMFASLIIFSIYRPTWVADFIVVYALWWLLRSVSLGVRLFLSYRQTKKALTADWLNLLKIFFNAKGTLPKIEQYTNANPPLQWKEPSDAKTLYSRIEHLKFLRQFKPWTKIFHAIIFVTYKESLEILRGSIRSYAESYYPAQKKIILVLAGEERDQENFLKIASDIQKEFGKKFFHILITVHPKNIPGEVPGKSANATYATKQLQKFLDTKKISYEDVILSNFDADTVTHPNYFAEVAFKYLFAENRITKAYQPTHLYHNNIWEVPILIRLVAFSCTFWRMAETTLPERFKSFSSRSLGLKTAIEVGYWDPAVIPEDSRQYWSAFLKYHGDHEVIPIFTPLYMDAVSSKGLWKTLKNQYLQLRRWAWGVTDFPFVVQNFFRDREIPWSKKLYNILFLLETHFFWATSGIVVTLTAWLPRIFNAQFAESVIAYRASMLVSWLLTLSIVGVMIFISISILLVPPHPKRSKWLAWGELILQWALAPLISIPFFSLPAIDAQTRLIFGKYLEYNVTEKVRKTEEG